ncbi:MAG: 30S ribosomal protein S9 [Bdellovibrionota bacterium]
MAKTTKAPKEPKVQGVVYYATGRRKTSSARIFLKPGSGKFVVNDVDLAKFAQSDVQRVLAASPFATTETVGKYDVEAKVVGGGYSSQIGAIRHGVARALSTVDDSKLRPVLKAAGMLTRDDRMVERKKYGRHKARKRPQFSKR